MPIFQDKVALVTGAGAGIGRAIALAMAEAGATIAAADIDRAAAQHTADQTASNTRRALAVEVDCGEVAQIDAMVARTVAELGRLDIIVNNAGVTRYAYIMDLTEADWDRIHRVNAKGVFFCLQRAAREMIRQNQADGSGGRIINIASVVAQMGNSGQANYVAAKAGLIGLTKAIAMEIASRGITVNAVAPGFIETPMTDVLPEQVKEKLKEPIPLGRMGAARDVSAAIVFLASDEAGYITGHVLNVNGGMHLA